MVFELFLEPSGKVDSVVPVVVVNAYVHTLGAEGADLSQTCGFVVGLFVTVVDEDVDVVVDVVGYPIHWEGCGRLAFVLLL